MVLVALNGYAEESYSEPAETIPLAIFVFAVSLALIALGVYIARPTAKDRLTWRALFPVGLGVCIGFVGFLVTLVAALGGEL